MAAIYKKELRSYFTSMTGYICMAFMLVVIGIYYAVINLASGYPYFGYTLSCVIVLFLLMTPVLTMRILAEEKSRKTDQLLLTAPVSLWKIVVDSIRTGTSGDLFLSVDPQPVWHGFPVDGLYRYSRLFPVRGSLHCHWSVHLFCNRESGHCGAADLLCAACILYYGYDHKIIAINGGGVLCYLDFCRPFCGMAGL